jgi:hypothetical protein
VKQNEGRPFADFCRVDGAVRKTPIHEFSLSPAA